MPRILMIHYSCGMGGAEKLMIQLSKEFEKSGFEVAFCFLKPSKHDVFNGLKTYFLPDYSNFKPLAVLEILKVIKDYSPDIIHTHTLAPFIHGSLAGMIAGVPVIHTRHGHERRSIKAGLIAGILAPFASAYVFVSRELSKSENKLLNFRNNFKIIHNGIDTSIKYTAKKPGKDFVIGSASRLTGVKNIKMLIDAFDIVFSKNKNCRLEIIGDGEEETKLKEYASKLKSSSRILFKGFRENVIKDISSMDLYVSSSFNEGISISILEAMLCKIPVIATAVGGTPEIIENGITGFLVPSNNPEILAERIEFVMKNKNKKIIKAIAENARKKVIADFNISRTAAEYIQLYKKALNK